MPYRRLALIAVLAAAASATQAQAPVVAQPGQWQIAVTFDQAAGGGLSAEALNAINGKQGSRDVCVKPGDWQAKAGELFAVPDGKCETAGLTTTSNSARFTLRCVDPSGAPIESQVSAQIQPGAYRSEARMSAKGQDGSPFTMRALVEAKRLGDCP